MNAEQIKVVRISHATPAEAGSQVVNSLRRSLADLAETSRLVEELTCEVIRQQASA